MACLCAFAFPEDELRLVWPSVAGAALLLKKTHSKVYVDCEFGRSVRRQKPHEFLLMGRRKVSGW